MELTTVRFRFSLPPLVVYDVKDTKFEWNSQLNNKIFTRQSRLFMMSKIQNLNGTHNNGCETPQIFQVVYDVKDTKFEWNSQRNGSNGKSIDRLFMMSKIQNLNGTHNGNIGFNWRKCGCL